MAGVFLCIGSAGAVAITPRSDHTATLLPDRTILVVGGLDGGAPPAPMTSVQLLANTRGSDKAALNSVAGGVARASHTATLLPNGEVLVAGGQTNAAGTITNTAQVYNPIKNCWHTAIRTMPGRPRVGHTATLLRTGDYAGSVLICGGRQTAGIGVAGDYWANCDIFQPSQTPAAALECAQDPGDFVAFTPSIQQPRAFHTATMLPDGRVFFAGGYSPTATPIPYTSTTEIYDPPRGIFTSAYPLSQGRAFHTATLMGDGKVFIASGFDGQDVIDNAEVSLEPFPSRNRGFLRSVEIYDPVGDHTSYAGTMIVRKMMHGIALGNDGQLVSWGGVGNILNSYISASDHSIVVGSVTFTCPARAVNVTDFHTNPQYTLTPFNTLPSYLTTPNVTGAIEKGALYMTVNPAEAGAEGPTITFSGGRITFDPAAPVAGTGLRADLAGAKVICDPNSASNCGVIDRRATFLHLVGGAGAAELSALNVQVKAITINAASINWPGNFGADNTGERIDLSGNTIQLTFSVTGLPTQMLGATLSNVTLNLSNLVITEKVGVDDVYAFTLGWVSASAMASGAVAYDPVTGTGQTTFSNITFNISPLEGVNFVTLSSAIACPYPAYNPGCAAGPDYRPPRTNTANMTPSTAMGTIEANYCPSRIIVGPAGGADLTIKTALGVTIIDRMSFSDVEMFNPGGNAPMTWRYTGHAFGAQRYRHTMTLSPGGTPVDIGGVACNPADWDASCPIVPVPNQSGTTPPTFSTGSFTVKAQNPFAEAAGKMSYRRANHTTTFLPDGAMLVTGGSNGPNILAASELYDPDTKTFTPTAGQMHETRSLHTATLLPNGRVLVAGGYSTNAASTGAIAGAELYYPDTRLWRSSSTMNSPRNNHTATLLPDGNVLVVGGYANGQYLSSAEIYVSTAQAWRSAAPLSSARALHTTTLLRDGRVMVIGGQTSLGVANTYEIYNPAAGTWSGPSVINPGGSAVSVRYHTTSLLASGEVLVAGGNDGSWETGRAMIYDPNPGGGWKYARSMPVARERHTATLLPNGNLAVIGGAKAVALGGQPNPSVEIYDPSTGLWSEWGGGMDINGVAYSLPAPRAYHTATLSRDGYIHVIGGNNGSANVDDVLTHFHMAAPHDSNSTGGTPSTRLSSVTLTDLSPFQRGERLTVIGRNFLGVTEASGGGAASANSDNRHPMMILQSVDGSGGNASQGDSGYILDLTTRIFQYSDINSWSTINDSITVILPGSPYTVPPPVGSESALLPYGWYRLHMGANDQFSHSYMVQAGPRLPSQPVQNLTAYDPATTYPAGVGTSSVTFTWNTPAGLAAGTDFDGYNVYIASTGVWISTRPDTQGALGYNFIKLDGMPASSAQGLIVQPYNISGDHPTLTHSATAYTLPLEPTHVHLATAPDSTFYVKWDTYSVETGTGNFAGTLYEVSQSTDANFNPLLATFPLTEGDFAPAQPLQLTPNTRYYFRVRACNRRSSPYGECSAYGLDRDLVNRYVSTQTLTAVAGLYGVAYATDTVNWYWTAAGGGAVYRVVNGTVAATAPNYVLANNVSTNSYSQTGLLQNQRTVVQVQVQDGGVVGPLSVPATAYSLARAPVWTALSCPASGGSPTEITTGSVVVEWNTQPNGLNSGGAGPEGNPTTYEVQYATGNWSRATGAWNPGIAWRTESLTNTSPAIISHKLILDNINHGVPIYVRARALNTKEEALDRAVNPDFADPAINPNGGWVNLISNVSDAAFTSTLQRPPTALLVVDPKGPTSATLWWLDPEQWQTFGQGRLGFPKYNFQVVMTTCAWYEGPTLRVDFSHSSGPYCGVTPSGADAADLPYNTNTALITNLNTWSTYYFTLNSYNLPHYDNNVANVVSSMPVQSSPPYAYYYTSVPGAVAGSLVIDVSARYGGSISSASVGVEAPGQVQHTVSFSAPPEAFPVDTQITIATFSVANDPRLAVCPGAGGPGGKLCGGDNNLVFEITADPAVQPKLPLFFTVNYKAGEPAVAGLTDPKQALLLRFDPATCKCVPVRSPTLPTSQSITAQLNHLSIFQVGTVHAASSPENMRIYPNPYYAARDGWLTIDGLPAHSRVRLFTLRGEMVLDTSADSHGIFTWQGANRGGRLVASGVYLVVAEGNGIKAIRKLVLLK